MLDQTFALSDLPKIGMLFFLEILLSADNALILGVVSSKLPEKLQKKALFIGFFSAFILRALVIFFIAFFLHYPLIRLAGAIYLLYISIQYFIKKRNQKSFAFAVPESYSFWKTVLFIELFDLVFAIDSIIAGVAFISDINYSTIYHPKLWIVYAGGIFGALSIRYAASFVAKLNQQYPRLEATSHLIIGWIGIKLSLQAFNLAPTYFPVIFWIGLLSLFALGFVKRKKNA